MSNFIAYNSSAGSGKTYTLVKEYLRIALGTLNPKQYRHILAMTFTNKAAAEMKERVLSALKALSSSQELSGTEKFLMDDLTKPLNIGGVGVSKEEIAARSAIVLKSILHNYNDFGISTIDKFTHKIIRTFANDLRLPLNFNIEINETELLKKSIDLLISEVGEHKSMTKLLVDYTNSRALQEENWRIENELYKFSRNLLKEDGERFLVKIRKLSINDFEQLKKKLYSYIGTFEKEVKEMAEEGLELVRSKGIEPNSFSRSFYIKYWEGLLNLKKFKPTDSTTKIIQGEGNWYASSVLDEQKLLIDRYKDDLVKKFDESQKYIEECQSEYVLNKLITKHIYSLALLNEIEKKIQEFKREHNVLNISDFNKEIAKVVSSEPAPFIYERLGEKFHHYLIDEFQDTSTIQWHNIVPLIDNSLGNGNMNLLVGDAKQAIYRFRGGEVEQIINLPYLHKHNDNPLLLEREPALIRNYLAKRLDINYRSKAEIVDFNNCFFNNVSSNLSEKYNSLYRDLKQEFDDKNVGGGVSVFFVDEMDKGHYESKVLKRLLMTINTSLNDGYRLKDIAILTRNNKEGISVAKFLIDNDIKVISSESLLLTSSSKVSFLIDLFDFLSSSENKKVAEVRVLGYLMDQLYDDDILDILDRYEEPLVPYLQSQGVSFHIEEMFSLSLYELTEHLLTTFEIDKEVDIYVQFFLDKVHEYSSRYDNSLINFLEWWRTKSDKFSITIPDGVDAVRVMSIHKSKGLEFPLVIYPFADSTVRISEDFFWWDKTGIDGLESVILPFSSELQNTTLESIYTDEVEKSKLDLINTLYVALTRPRDRLFIISRVQISKGKRKLSTHGSISDYLYDFCQMNLDNQVEKDLFLFGEFVRYNRVLDDKVEKNDLFDTISYSNWRDRIAISYQAPLVWDVDSPEDIGEYGSLIHSILSHVKLRKDLDPVLDRFMNKGILTKKELQPIRKQLENIFNISGVKDLFEDIYELKNERSIALPTGEIYQPDRVVRKGDRTYLVDYKTGEKKKAHKEQVIHYKQILTRMGYPNVSSYLLYIGSCELIEV